MSSAKPQIKRTYGSRGARLVFTPLNSSDTSPSSSPPRETITTKPANSVSNKRKRSLSDLLHPNCAPLAKRQQRNKLIAKKTTLTQLHFITDTPIVRTCSLCDLTYTRGAPDDEALHKSHCARVQEGFEWGKDEEKDKLKACVTEVEGHVRLSSGEVGRIVSVSLLCGGKLGQKLSTYLQTVNTVLSAPSMTDDAMKASKAYLFLLPSHSGKREVISGCAIAQRIEHALAVATETAPSHDQGTSKLVQVDSGLFCYPERLPTPVGIPRLFVSSAYRRKGIAQALLHAVCKNFIHGCQLDASKGELAFSQPTSLGRAVMETFGKGGIRVFEE